jgi:hypothetical protein
MLTPDEVVIKERVEKHYIGADYAWSQVYDDLHTLLATIEALREELATLNDNLRAMA